MVFYTSKLNTRKRIEVGTFASAAGGRKSEQKGVAAVKNAEEKRKPDSIFGNRNRT